MDPKIRTLIEWIREAAAPAQGLLVPISGGSDSALAFWLCTRAFPDKTVGIHAGTTTTLRCWDWFASHGSIGFEDISGRYVDEEMRWARFLSDSLERGWWLVGCRNRTEDELGTYSLASRVATFLPIVGVYKTDVMRMCGSVGVPEEIMASSRRADPDCGRPAELAEIPFEGIDAFLDPSRDPETFRALVPAQRAYLQGVLDRNAFKAKLPIRGPNL